MSRVLPSCSCGQCHGRVRACGVAYARLRPENTGSTSRCGICDLGEWGGRIDRLTLLALALWLSLNEPVACAGVSECVERMSPRACVAPSDHQLLTVELQPDGLRIVSYSGVLTPRYISMNHSNFIGARVGCCVLVLHARVTWASICERIKANDMI